MMTVDHLGPVELSSGQSTNFCYPFTATPIWGQNFAGPSMGPFHPEASAPAHGSDGYHASAAPAASSSVSMADRYYSSAAAGGRQEEDKDKDYNWEDGSWQDQGWEEDGSWQDKGWEDRSIWREDKGWEDKGNTGWQDKGNTAGQACSAWRKDSTHI
jgi:hypothetical protein